MAEFVGLDKSVTDLADKCVAANRRQDIADFLVAQQKMIQEGVITARKENKDNNGNKNGPNNAPGNAGTGGAKALSAYERMKAMMNGK